MEYSSISLRFNGDMPEYFAECFTGFEKQYDASTTILSDREIDAVRQTTQQDEACFDVVRSVRDAVDADSALHAAASLMRYVLCDARMPWENELWREDTLIIEGFKNEQVNLLFVVAQLAKTLLERKPPQDLNQENIGAFCGYTRQCFNQKGYWGINEFSWNMLCAGGCMFMCGALKFCPSYFTKDFAALEKGGEYVSILCGSYNINSRGEITSDDDTVLKTVYSETDDGFTAHRILRDGTVQPTAEFFSKKEYNILLRGGSPTLDFHIPSNIEFTPEVVADAMRRAVSFYSSFLPTHKTVAVTVYSWLFSPQMHLVMGEGSNILSVQHKAHLLPVTATFDHTCRFLREGSSLAERIKSVTESGRRFHIGIAYFPISDL